MADSKKSSVANSGKSSITYPRPEFDLTLYLVTDSSPAILGDKNLIEVVDAALMGGVTIVQYREKHADTGVMIQMASKLHHLTGKHNADLIINDRIDVCLAVGAEGVHIGQDDMSCAEARRILGPNAIIGVTASTVEEAKKAVEDGADYLGIGTTFATPTKLDTKHIIGTRGLQEMLAKCSIGTEKEVPCVAIGSINATNVQRVLHQSTHQNNSLDGVAVVSAIMAASDPQKAAEELRLRIQSAKDKLYVAVPPGTTMTTSLPDLLQQVPSIIKQHANSSVLSHNMTNTVVQNFAANVCLATGSSPIMSLNGDEAADLAKLGGALVINMGTITPATMEAYLAGVKAYNAVANPVLFDPVGGGATSVRREAIKTLMRGGFFDVIKGNEGEISAVVGTTSVQQRGVDSGPSTSTPEDKARIVKALAQRERCIVLMTGEVDYLSDGTRTVSISNGHKWLGKITGSGCALGSTIASYVAVHKQDKFLGALAGILHYEIAAEKAAEHPNVNGPGTFIPAFLDHLHLIAEDVERFDVTKLAKVQELN